MAEAVSNIKKTYFLLFHLISLPATTFLVCLGYRESPLLQRIVQSDLRWMPYLKNGLELNLAQKQVYKRTCVLCFGFVLIKLGLRCYVIS